MQGSRAPPHAPPAPPAGWTRRALTFPGPTAGTQAVPGRAGAGTEASGPASELPARNTPIRGSRTIELFFFYQLKLRPAKPPETAGRPLPPRDLSPQPRGPAFSAGAVTSSSAPPLHSRNPPGLPSRAKGKRSPGKDSCIRRPVSAQPVSFPVYKRLGELMSFSFRPSEMGPTAIPDQQ